MKALRLELPKLVPWKEKINTSCQIWWLRMGVQKAKREMQEEHFKNARKLQKGKRLGTN